MHENKSDYPRLKELDNASLFYCPKCGKIMYVEENEVKTVKCLACGNNNIIDTNFLLVDFLLLSEEEKRKWENNLLNNCIIKNKEFNMRQYNLFCNPNTTDSLYNCYDEKYRDIENEIKEKEYLSVKKPVENVGVVLWGFGEIISLLQKIANKK